MPDTDYIMTDDELDALEKQERDEFEARLKARREKTLQDRQARDEKAAKKQALLDRASEILKELDGKVTFESLFDKLVPSEGMCETLAGELIRAVNKIEYRWFNDGDKFNEGYGIETCGQPAYLLMNFETEDVDEAPFWDLMYEMAESSANDDVYEKNIERLKELVVDFIMSHQELLATENKVDMYDILSRERVKEFFDEQDLIPYYDLEDVEFPDELLMHLEKNISERDLQWEIESWLENMGAYSADVRVDPYYVSIEHLEKDDYDELESNLHDWLEQYADELTSQYGDPYEDDEEESSEEEGEE